MGIVNKKRTDRAGPLWMMMQDSTKSQQKYLEGLK